MNKFIVSSVLAFAFALGCGAARAADLVIDQILPTTGPIAPNGQGLQAGGKAYIDFVNANGGVNGRKIVLNSMDDQYKPEETVRLVQKAIAEHKPLAFMNFTGAANIELLIKSGDLAKAHVPLIGPRAGGQSLRKPVNPLIFHTYSSYWDELERMVDVFTTMGSTRFAVVYQDDAFGRDGFEGAQAALKKRNIPLLLAVPYPRGSVDVAPAGEKILAANPQIVLFCTTAPYAAAFVKRFREKMAGMQFAGFSAIDSATIVKLAGADLARGFVIAQNMPNPTKLSVRLVREHRDVMAKFAPNVKPNFYTLGGYATAKVVVEALRRAGPQPTREKFIAALEGMRDFDIGGVEYTFGRELRMGTTFVELLIINGSGEPQS
jgi:ABC-type branched-subunit amino acid transport system substrate-binding protein